jgi:ubiquinone/menaquinone biosynthesis C-methylase UbiE
MDSYSPLGDYAVVAEQISAAGELLVERAGVEPGMDVLDIATGTGNSALPAARRGARVTGIELIVELLDIARERVADLGLEVDWIEGGTEELPFEGRRFDRVLSAFGHMFALRHERVAGELVRVCRPGGVIGFCAWTPEGLGGRLLSTAASYLPPRPPVASPPSLWGSEDHVRKLLDPYVGSLEFERHSVAFDARSAGSWMTTLGVESDEVRTELMKLFGESREAEYLLTIARL